MKYILIMSLFFSFSAWSQDMKTTQKVSEIQNEVLQKILNEDKTDENTYVVGKYTCHQFAKTLYLQRSSLVEDLSAYDLEGIADDWGVIIKRLEETAKMPIYTLAISNEEYGFYHMINAVLINEAAPESLESYIFLEPQTDEVFMTSEAVYKRYSKYYDKTAEHEPLKVGIGLFEKLNFNGSIYQSWGKTLYSFEI